MYTRSKRRSVSQYTPRVSATVCLRILIFGEWINFVNRCTSPKLRVFNSSIVHVSIPVSHVRNFGLILLRQVFVDNEEIKSEVKRILIYECRCNERQKLKLRDLHVSHTLEDPDV